MKVFNFENILLENGIKDPLDSEIYKFVYNVESIGITICKDGPWIAGGAILKTFIGEPIDTDIDVFFASNEQLYECFVKMEKNSKLVSESKFSKTFEFLSEHNGVESTKKIQFVNYVYKPKASEIISEFDINICQFAFDGERIVVEDDVLEHVRNRKMKILVDKITHAGSTLKRIVKYSRKGFVATDENLNEFNQKFLLIPNNPSDPHEEKY